ncbi:sugar transferase [Cryobacterium sp. SO2]|uniref:sugar transferase n=1 Tax=Cryobacterium sp. SO2 TaxID=1897060 RepID=UPI00223DE923|nr:sugar transferase [Cryobacterium sp. SO2]WEO77978.1 sugar transferase [Cryobacterium sp. SO2]
MITDLLVLIWVVFGVQIAWFGMSAANVGVGSNRTVVAVSYTLISVSIILSWMLMLGIFGTRGYRVLGTGPQEYRQVADATVRLFGLVAIVAFLLKIDFARGYILIAFPLGLAVLVFSRWIWRIWLGAKRADGQYCSRVLLVGSRVSTAHLAGELARNPAAGYLVVGACVPNSVGTDPLPGLDIPVFGDVDNVQEAMTAVGADTVVVASSGELSPQQMRELSWRLEPGRQHLVVAPSLTDIGGPRIHTRPVAGLPLIHVEVPRYEGRRQFAKRAFDLVGSALFILVLSPVLAAIAIAVKLTTPGPILFQQERVGINGDKFRMIKFRSMVTGAENQLAALHGMDRNAGNSVMFKMRNDPRITPLGGFLRRFSLDELPQLFNVFAGTMSLVGPRPSLSTEVDEYETYVHRRFLVKPGITGLWQVSGRSNLSWADSVRLDLFYVENWSITGDISILWRTTRAVLARDGAY